MTENIHSFYIPVMGLAFTIDSPLKVARYGISSVVSIIDDVLIEDMRRHYCAEYGLEFVPVPKNEEDYRAKRITAYLNMMDGIVKWQLSYTRSAPLDTASDLTRYLDLLDNGSPLKKLYAAYLKTTGKEERARLENRIRSAIKPGSIDVNIMSKIDAVARTKNGDLLPPEYSAASAALRGYAHSRLHSSVVLSAGFNPRLYGYLAGFSDFYPDQKGETAKKVILKVSDFRSARIQGQYLAKRGILVSEFRIESGLNCGGHAFPTEGYLMGPILQEFKEKKEQLAEELLTLCKKVWQEKNLDTGPVFPHLRICVQGGIGTAGEDRFLHEYYQVNGTGWGTPFLLVPEATTVDEATLDGLAKAKAEELFLSESSPLGVPFNNYSLSASEAQRLQRVKKGRPGSPCLKQYLVSNTEFTKEPVCTASRQYIHLKLQELDSRQLPKEAYDAAYTSITAKECLCEDLAAPAYINTQTKAKLKTATAICPGPDMAFFSGKFSLRQMTDHIYGRTNLLNTATRPNMFINELKLYVDYLKKEVKKTLNTDSAKQISYFSGFMNNLVEGIAYYKALIPQIKIETAEYIKKMRDDLSRLEEALSEIRLPAPAVI